MAYEWSDGTKYDFKGPASTLPSDSDLDRDQPSCVYITPAGAWLQTSCSSEMDGAVCYTTSVTTASQSTTLLPPPTHHHCL